jgi:hypothetical protein
MEEKNLFDSSNATDKFSNEFVKKSKVFGNY